MDEYIKVNPKFSNSEIPMAVNKSYPENSITEKKALLYADICISNADMDENNPNNHSNIRKELINFTDSVKELLSEIDAILAKPQTQRKKPFFDGTILKYTQPPSSDFLVDDERANNNHSNYCSDKKKSEIQMVNRKSCPGNSITEYNSNPYNRFKSRKYLKNFIDKIRQLLLEVDTTLAKLPTQDKTDIFTSKIYEYTQSHLSDALVGDENANLNQSHDYPDEELIVLKKCSKIEEHLIDILHLDLNSKLDENIIANILNSKKSIKNSIDSLSNVSNKYCNKNKMKINKIKTTQILPSVKQSVKKSKNQNQIPVKKFRTKKSKTKKIKNKSKILENLFDNLHLDFNSNIDENIENVSANLRNSEMSIKISENSVTEKEIENLRNVELYLSDSDMDNSILNNHSKLREDLKNLTDSLQQSVSKMDAILANCSAEAKKVYFAGTIFEYTQSQSSDSLVDDKSANLNESHDCTDEEFAVKLADYDRKFAKYEAVKAFCLQKYLEPLVAENKAIEHIRNNLPKKHSFLKDYYDGFSEAIKTEAARPFNQWAYSQITEYTNRQNSSVNNSNSNI